MTRRKTTLTAKPVLSLIISACFALPLSAFGHAIMVKSQPEAEATIAESPKQVDVWFNDKVGSEYKALAVINSAGQRVDNKDLEQETFDAAKELARGSSRPLGAVVSELASEALRMRRFPGIVFAGPPGRRRARVEGSGLDVWEVMTVYRDVGRDVEKTREVLQHLTVRQVDAALRYARAYPEEIEARIAENERPIEEWLRLYPHIKVFET